ncbi:alkanesulfonate monooxygenase SsuD/methylene tetrahydromethanopterin reductase-like flavin-dependent oxidoreductase (luciferase family) [Streptomyces sp. SAI-135]|jgi:alkanesulfonate monooxygenase SsuD/methylene tetrahydromethanopterin reductase-like flavin-dependent oxidoreductase (luciferase family)|uniref:LLM class flavin-dependent oxidoreductase n=1 Tax=Streptomyces TaxID=1883 RepID=UPI00113FEF4D|nr:MULTISPECIES: LLM class flavin-dependent oxidoreductase [Streptomyces]MDH6521872.1 alkanesulfonate monooxygenase SsuD/methylene tetrahydromethanopterin reductase-like flavin-dependent oxidoreductase (luciferase family) [Streptomyces sp. SAI-090]MDH6573238.1 alkanesulfonate monooxygenase SsuD/methylene tetrahydromethanopterin reductase-like flavin-dependent oxidoreductase (luciferase family) [Streptomyces sp. SAI-117]MDH6614027.1 alkanesulfonate monooxygenase SsuD/methylene tetrahydromethanopt
MLRIGLLLPMMPQDGGLHGDIPGLARWAESIGVTSLWATDHLLWHSPVFECMTAVTLAAAATERCRVGTCVLQLPLRRPVEVARVASTIQHVSDGRFVLGVGAGLHEGEFDAAGVRYDDRGARLDAGIRQLRGLWAGTDDRYGHQRIAAPPIWIGGASRRAARRVAALGDGWMPLFVSPGGLAARFADLDAMLQANGRRPEEVARAVVLWTRVTDSAAEEREAASWLGRFYGLPDAVVARHLIVGPPERCLERMLEFTRAGATEILVSPAADDPSPTVAALFAALRTTLPQARVHA